MKVANKTVLITGANRGIGRALVNEALQRGASKVYAASRSGVEHADQRVTPVNLDVTSSADVQRAAGQIGALDILINNAGIGLYDDLSNPELIEQHMAVNLFATLKVTRAFLPLLENSKGAIVNNLSITALAPVPMMSAYSISKAAAFNMTRTVRALVARRGVAVHAALPGPIDTDMTQGLEIPKASPESTAQGIFDGLEKGEEEIFPDPVSQAVAEGWRAGVVKALERQLGAFLPQAAENA
jgi:NAD(P)-dependent dehydrogenase (short-subunit alcohol dehydrogenase family)